MEKKLLSEVQKNDLLNEIRNNKSKDVEELRKKFHKFREYSLNFIFSSDKENEESGYPPLTPLMEAINSASPQMVEILIEMGADVNYPNKDDETPLIFLLIENESLYYQEEESEDKIKAEAQRKATIERSEALTKIAEILIEAKADAAVYLSSETPDGKKEKTYVLDYINPDTDLFSIIAKGLVKQKKPLDPNFPEQTPLLFAAKVRHYTLYSIFLKQGESQNDKDESGNTPFMLVAEQGRQDLVELELAVREDAKLLNETNKVGETAAILAAKNKHYHIYEILASRGADLNIKDKSGKSAADYIPEVERYREIIIALKRKDEKTFNDLIKDQEKLFQAIAYHLKDDKSSDHDEISLKLISKLDPININKISKLYNQYLLEMAYSISDLRILLAHGASPHITTSNGHSLIDVFNIFVKIDWINELIKHSGKKTSNEMQMFTQQAKMITNSGHIMGLDNPIRFLRPDTQEPVTIPTSGFYTYEAIRLLIERLSEYLEFLSEPDIKPRFEKILLGFQNIHRYMTGYGAKQAIELIKNYQNDPENILIFPLRWREHGITIAFYKDKMVLCNRGEGMGESGTLIYTLKNRKEINLDFLEKCFAGGEVIEKDVLLKHIMSVVDDSIKAIPLESKGQKHGTCSFVNAKSAVQGLLYVMEQENFLKEGLNKENKTSDDQARSTARKQYKKFTSFMRDLHIERLIREYKSTPAEYRDPYIKIIKQIIQLHHGQIVELSATHDRSAKKSQEFFRLAKLFSALFQEKEFDEYVQIFGSNLAALNEETRNSKIFILFSMLCIVSNEREISEILKSFKKIDPSPNFESLYSNAEEFQNEKLCKCLAPYVSSRVAPPKKAEEVIFSKLPSKNPMLGPAPAPTVPPQSTEGGSNKP